MRDYVRRDSCRSCGSKKLRPILDLGAMPPANAYVKPGDLNETEASFPLSLSLCEDCFLLQVPDVVAPDILFKDYHYFTGANEPMVKHFRDYAENAIKPFIRSSSDLVVDIGGNDGVLLGFAKSFAKVLNIDPADNLSSASECRGVSFYNAFFSRAVAEEVLKTFGHARVVTANNVFAHVDDVNDVFMGASTLIGDEGVFICEVHWVKNLLDLACFDQVYHEHLCFYSLHALMPVIARAGMTIFDVDIVPTQGESLRVFAARDRKPKESVERVLSAERAAGLVDIDRYLRFARTVAQNKEDTLSLIAKLKAQGKRIIGYGAPAKGNTLLNYYGLDSNSIEYLTDTTPAKQGLYSPGARIPIVAPQEIQFRQPDFILLLAWNYRDAILAKEQTLRDKGINFFVTTPRLEIL